MVKMSKERVALVVDLDYTLVRTNTLFEFMSLICPIRYAILSRLLKPIGLFNKILGRDIYKLMLARLCFNGLSRTFLEYAGRVYYERIIRKRNMYNQSILKSLQVYKHIPMILLTASSDFIAWNFKHIGFKLIYSSRTLYSNDVFHGIDDLYLRKHTVAKALSRFFDRIVVLDDNPEKELYSIPNVKIIKVRVE